MLYNTVQSKCTLLDGLDHLGALATQIKLLVEFAIVTGQVPPHHFLVSQ